MARIERFEEIDAWKKARELTRAVYRVTNGPAFARDFGLKDQIRSAAVSVMSNIAEGFERDGNREFVQFLATAKGSVGEVRSQLYVAWDAGYITETEFEAMSKLAEEVSRMIRGFMRYLCQTEIKGDKFRPHPPHSSASHGGPLS